MNRTPEVVDAALNYLTDSSERPGYYAYKPPAGTPRQTGRFAPQSVPIRNGRPPIDELSLDRQGFELVKHETAVSDFYDRTKCSACIIRGSNAR